jgi:hypothetical protein
VLAEDDDQLVGQVDDSLRPVLRGPDRVAASVSLELAGDRELTAKEVDVSDLDRCCLAFAETCERAQGDVGAESFPGRHALAVSVRDQTADLLSPSTVA